jgi:DNA-binding transcriptional regulator LsrR (DeoR family)
VNARAGGPDLDTIKRAPRRVCVVAGRSKAASLRGALASGLVTDLILDESVGQAILQP